jgi:large subunit ribosomal protein L17
MAGRKLGRNPSHRRALLRNLVTSLLEHERIVTTVPKAKEIRPLAEKMITLGKRDTLHARRQVKAYLLDDAVARKVFDELGPRFSSRPGGYSRIIRFRNRPGDGAEEAIIELMGSGLVEKRAEMAASEATETAKEATGSPDGASTAEASGDADADEDSKKG